MRAVFIGVDGVLHLSADPLGAQDRAGVVGYGRTMGMTASLGTLRLRDGEDARA